MDRSRLASGGGTGMGDGTGTGPGGAQGGGAVRVRGQTVGTGLSGKDTAYGAGTRVRLWASVVGM